MKRVVNSMGNLSNTDSLLSVRLEELSHVLERRALISDQIAEAIRGMIIAGQLNPGERIVESRIARQWEWGSRLSGKRLPRSAA